MLEFLQDFRVEIYPREGTETNHKISQITRYHVEIYPREGTETPLLQRLGHRPMLKFIPVRGRKPFFFFRTFVFVVC